MRQPAESPWLGSLQPELLSLWRVPNSTQSWSLGSFTFTNAAQRNAVQGYSPLAVAESHAQICNALSAFAGKVLGSIRSVSVTFLRHLSTKMLGSTKRPAP